MRTQGRAGSSRPARAPLGCSATASRPLRVSVERRSLNPTAASQRLGVGPPRRRPSLPGALGKDAPAFGPPPRRPAPRACEGAPGPPLRAPPPTARSLRQSAALPGSPSPPAKAVPRRLARALPQIAPVGSFDRKPKPARQGGTPKPRGRAGASHFAKRRMLLPKEATARLPGRCPNGACLHAIRKGFREAPLRLSDEP